MLERDFFFQTLVYGVGLAKKCASIGHIVLTSRVLLSYWGKSRGGGDEEEGDTRGSSASSTNQCVSALPR